MSNLKNITPPPIAFSRLRTGLAAIATMLLLATGLGVPAAGATEPEECGSSDFCYSGYSAQGLKTIAKDLSVNGRNSRYYEQMKAAMDKDTRGILKVTSAAIATKGQQVDMPVRLIGILHDDKADGTGRAGLTFQTVNSLPRAYCMNGAMPGNDSTERCSGTNVNEGGWRDSDLRENMNGGEVWESMPADLRDAVEPVVKLTNNTVGGSSRSAATATNDRLWLQSGDEFSKPWSDPSNPSVGKEGFRYEAYGDESFSDITSGFWLTSSGETPAGAYSLNADDGAWLRSPARNYSFHFSRISSWGWTTDDNALWRHGVAPAFCL